MHYYQRLRDLREDCDKTQKEIADFLQIAQVQYHRYETGKRGIPYHMVIKLAEYYKVSLDYIAGLTNEKMGLTKSSLNKNETQLINVFRQLDAFQQGRVVERAETFLETAKK